MVVKIIYYGLVYFFINSNGSITTVGPVDSFEDLRQCQAVATVVNDAVDSEAFLTACLPIKFDVYPDEGDD